MIDPVAGQDPDPVREIEILSHLVGFDTRTGQSTLPLVGWVQDLLERAGWQVTRIVSASGDRAGLLARFGTGPGGILLSGHADVVPVAGQDWHSDPFTLTRRDDRLVGRGTTDMKGFLACALALAETLRDAPPSRPVMMALSWDEEIGCRGIPEMIPHLLPTLGRPDLVIVGEPTRMRLCIGHKGKAAYRAVCHGTAGHSAMAPRYTNALHLGADLIGALRRVQARVAESGPRGEGYEVPHATLHVGRMSGGVALNIVPDRAELEFEIRHLARESAAALLAEVTAGLPAGIEIAEVTSYPALDADPLDPGIARLAARLDNPAPIRVSFGTEAGVFAALGLPTVVCGPGDMADGHQPDESIAISELARCARVLRAVTG